MRICCCIQWHWLHWQCRNDDRKTLVFNNLKFFLFSFAKLIHKNLVHIIKSHHLSDWIKTSSFTRFQRQCPLKLIINKPSFRQVLVVLIDQALLGLPVQRKTLIMSQFTFFLRCNDISGNKRIECIIKTSFSLTVRPGVPTGPGKPLRPGAPWDHKIIIKQNMNLPWKNKLLEVALYS